MPSSQEEAEDLVGDGSRRTPPDSDASSSATRSSAAVEATAGRRTSSEDEGNQVLAGGGGGGGSAEAPKPVAADRRQPGATPSASVLPTFQDQVRESLRRGDAAAAAAAPTDHHRKDAPPRRQPGAAPASALPIFKDQVRESLHRGDAAAAVPTDPHIKDAPPRHQPGAVPSLPVSALPTFKDQVTEGLHRGDGAAAAPTDRHRKDAPPPRQPGAVPSSPASALPTFKDQVRESRPAAAAAAAASATPTAATAAARAGQPQAREHRAVDVDGGLPTYKDQMREVRERETDDGNEKQSKKNLVSFKDQCNQHPSDRQNPPRTAQITTIGDITGAAGDFGPDFKDQVRSAGFEASILKREEPTSLPLVATEMSVKTDDDDHYEESTSNIKPDTVIHGELQENNAHHQSRRRPPPLLASPVAATTRREGESHDALLLQAHVVDSDLEAAQLRREILQELRDQAPVAAVVEEETGIRSDSLTRARRKRVIVFSVVALLAAIAVAVGVLVTSSSSDDGTGVSQQPSTAPTLPFWMPRGNDIGGKATGNRLGDSVALSGDGSICATGGTGDPFQDGAEGRGRLRIFELINATTWTQMGQDIVGEYNKNLGRSIDLSKDGMIVACGEYFGGDRVQGRVVIYRYDAGLQQWLPLGQEIFGDGIDGNQPWFGWSVSLSDDGFTLAVGAPINNFLGINAGRLRVYRYNAASQLWVQFGSDILPTQAIGQLGTSVSLSSSGLCLVAGAYFTRPELTYEAGRVTIYQHQNGDWEQIGSIDGEDKDDFLGWAVSLSGDGQRFACSDILHDNEGGVDAGRVRVFELVNSTWTLLGNPIFGNLPEDELGSSVALSSDGMTLVVGAIQLNTDGVPPGYLRVLRFDGEDWIQQGPELIGEDQGDRYGTSSAISRDGLIVAGGSPFNNNGNGMNSGLVRVYETTSATAIPTTVAPTTSPPTQQLPTAPVAAPITLEFIRSITFSTEPLAYPPPAVSATPEELALQWILDVDPKAYATQPATRRLQEQQRYALVTLWFATEGSTQWIDNSGWLTGASECTWFGVSCNVSNQIMSLKLNGNGLTGGFSSLTGGFPPDAALLKSLTEIDFSGNPSLFGPLPSAIGNLENLRVLSLNASAFVNELPDTFGNLSQLEEIYLNDNKFTGTLPESMAGLINMERFWVQRNEFSGTLPYWLPQWTNLFQLYINENSFSGSIPSDIGDTNIQYFWVRDNKLTGTLPASLAQLSFMKDFFTTGNFFSPGRLPEWVSNWNILERIEIDNNAFTGPLPASAVGQWPLLTHFSADNNRFTGSLPESIGNWQNLTTFHIRDNNFTSSLPASVTQWSNILNFYSYQNDLTGTLPEGIGAWTNLENFFIRSNHFNGTLPESIGQWSNIRLFSVDLNEFTGTVPESVCNWTSLEKVYIDVNSFTGSVPECVCMNNLNLVDFWADCVSEIECPSECCTDCV